MLEKKIVKSSSNLNYMAHNIIVYCMLNIYIYTYYVNIPCIIPNIQRRHRHTITGSDDVQEHATDLYTMRPFSFWTGRKLSIMGVPVLNHICLVMFLNCGNADEQKILLRRYPYSVEEFRCCFLCWRCFLVKTLLLYAWSYKIKFAIHHLWEQALNHDPQRL